MKMDTFDKSAVVDGTVLEVMQPCNATVKPPFPLLHTMRMQDAAYSAHINFILPLFIT